MGPTLVLLLILVYNGNLYSLLQSTKYSNSLLFRDAPNTWPPHQYIILKALQALPPNVSSSALPQPSGQLSTFSLIPTDQLGIAEKDLPGQPITGSVNASMIGSAADINKGNGTVTNGGIATNGEGWSRVLQRELANRYFTSALCGW
jgi:alpha,alpha-trehalase